MGLGKDVQPEALRRFREARGWTHEQLADFVWASPLEVAAWEAGTVSVPLEQARRIREGDRAARRLAVPGATALARCEWADTHFPGLHRAVVERPSGLSSFALEVRLHVLGCHTCEQVTEFAHRLRRIKGDPGLGWDLWESLGRFLDTRPRIVLYPMLIGSGTAIAVGLAQLLGRLPDTLKEGMASDAGLALVWGAAAFSIFGVYLRGRMRRRPFLRGMVKSAAGVGVTLLAWYHMNPAAHALSGPVLLGGAAAAVAAGVLSGLWSRWKGEDEDDVQPALPEPGPGYPLLHDSRLKDVDAALAASGVPVEAAGRG